MTPDVAARPPLDADRLADARAAGTFRVEVVEALPSTNAVVAQRARAGEPEGLVVVTEHQTSGRGRLDRTWQTPPRAALTFSVLLRPQVPPADWPWLPLLTGHALARTLRDAGVTAAGVKWPNDVLVDDLKVAGILVERVETPTGPAAVVGIGLNVSTTATELPVATATSVALALGTEPDRTVLLLAVLAGLRGEYDAWRTGGGDALRASYAAACVTVGRTVRVELPSGELLTGPATGIDRGGRLLVRGPHGETAVGAGDVVHVRAVGG